MDKSAKIYIVNHQDMVGSAIRRKLEKEGYTNIIIDAFSSLDLTNYNQVDHFFKREKPEYVIFSTNIMKMDEMGQENGSFELHESLQIQNNIIHSSYITGVKKLLFLAPLHVLTDKSLTFYNDECFLNNILESANEPLIAVVSGIKMCMAYRKRYGCNYITALSSDLFGYNDDYWNDSQVISSLIRRFHEAKFKNITDLTIPARSFLPREFLFADDLADACFYLMATYNKEAPINIGTEQDISNGDLAFLIKDIVGFNGEVSFDFIKSDTKYRKLINAVKLQGNGWKHNTTLEQGIELTYQDFLLVHFPGVFFEIDA